ncbi:MAG: hypothetical protein ACI9QA_000827 [Methanobacteriota archaeon]|jgi:hypothetical protein
MSLEPDKEESVTEEDEEELDLPLPEEVLEKNRSADDL